MKIYAPEYFKAFKCIADKCSHSCCVGWRISIDENTEEKYKHLRGEYADQIRESIREDDDGAYIPLDECGRCPHLTKSGLCRIIELYGEESVAEICREHPRFYNVLQDRIEAGLGASCIEAARIILESDISGELVEIGECEVEPCLNEYDARAIRNKVLSFITKSADYEALEDEIIDTYALPRCILSCDSQKALYAGLEFLDAGSRGMFTKNNTKARADSALLKRVLWYFIYRYLTTSESEYDARVYISFALAAARCVERLTESAGSATEALRIYSEEIEYSTDNMDSILFYLSEKLMQ